MRFRVPPKSLRWQVFLVNAGLIVAGVALLALTPLTISHPIRHASAEP